MVAEGMFFPFSASSAEAKATSEIKFQFVRTKIETPPKIEKHEVKEPLGTVAHWVSRSPGSNAMLGDDMKRELNQLSIIDRRTKNKEEKGIISAHNLLIKDCISFQKDNLCDLGMTDNIPSQRGLTCLASRHQMKCS